MPRPRFRNPASGKRKPRAITGGKVFQKHVWSVAPRGDQYEVVARPQGISEFSKTGATVFFGPFKTKKIANEFITRQSNLII